MAQPNSLEPVPPVRLDARFSTMPASLEELQQLHNTLPPDLLSPIDRYRIIPRTLSRGKQMRLRVELNRSGGATMYVHVDRTTACALPYVRVWVLRLPSRGRIALSVVGNSSGSSDEAEVETATSTSRSKEGVTVLDLLVGAASDEDVLVRVQNVSPAAVYMVEEEAEEEEEEEERIPGTPIQRDKAHNQFTSNDRVPTQFTSDVSTPNLLQTIDLSTNSPREKATPTSLLQRLAMSTQTMELPTNPQHQTTLSVLHKFKKEPLITNPLHQ